ncbi:MAG: hypothetical protein CM15mP120_29180 [Pseudomonadota bacterium]|nr:MAG: hypothetical protein CM15mP120_29180 [Pseudomonadota bacterium]
MSKMLEGAWVSPGPGDSARGTYPRGVLPIIVAGFVFRQRPLSPTSVLNKCINYVALLPSIFSRHRLPQEFLVATSQPCQSGLVALRRRKGVDAALAAPFPTSRPKNLVWAARLLFALGRLDGGSEFGCRQQPGLRILSG